MRVLLVRYSLLIAVSLGAGVGPLLAQRGRVLVDAGWGSLAEDPFHTALSFRGSAGWVIGAHDAVVVQFTRQAADKSAELDNSPHKFIGLAWHHGVQRVFAGQESRKQLYLLRLVGGIMLRRDFRESANGSMLRSAPFVGAGLVIRYPLRSRFAVTGTLEDGLAFLPAQTVSSFCSTPGGTTCYPAGGPNFYSVPIAAETRNHFGAFVTLEFRP